MMQKFDIIVSGGGMVGAVCANLLANSGYKVAMIEAGMQVNCDNKDNRSLRVSALAAKHLKLLQDLGIQDLIHDSRIGHYNAMQVWDNNSTGEVNFKADSGKQLGAIIENQWIVFAAQKKLQDYPNVTSFYQHVIESFNQSERSVTATLDNQSVLQGRLILACEGAHSPLRKMAGIEIKNNNYQQQAIVCFLQIEHAPGHTALQAFNQSGPVALLPIYDQVYSLVWSCDQVQAEQWLDADETRFIGGLKAHLRRDFGDIKCLSERASFPLRQMYASEIIQDRLVLMGDSAHVVHPMAGQGVNLGLSDVVELNHQLAGINLRDKTEIDQALKRHRRRRNSEVVSTSELMSLLYRIYRIEHPMMAWMRGTGMKGVNRLTLVKQWLLQQAGS